MMNPGTSETAQATLAMYIDVLGRLVTAQPEAVRAAATVVADAVGAGGVVHVHDTGHMIGQELVSRTGGLVAFSRLEYGAHVSSGGIAREGAVSLSPDEVVAATTRLIGWTFDQRTVRVGDALVLSSVSGVSVPVVELAVQARERGIPVVALTSVTFSTQLASKHPSGQRLCDVANVVLDNLAPYGDAAQVLDGFDAKVVPISGVAGAALMWAVVAEATAMLVGRGIAPSVYPSINLPDGPQLVAEVEAQYRSAGR